MGEDAVDFKGSTFSVPAGRKGRFVEHLAEYCAASEELGVLEVGCGSGEELVELAQHMPGARFTGLDISRPGIERGQELCEQEGLGERIELQVMDYMEAKGGPWDVILSDSTFHLMAASEEQVFARLSRDLHPGGLLVFTMPRRCFYNYFLITVRRILRLFRGRLMDKLILGLARRLHGAMPEEQLLERIHYMYVIPNKYHCAGLVARLWRNHQLGQVAVKSLPHASMAQPKHVIAFFRRQSERGE